jgi:hypothetical protein
MPSKTIAWNFSAIVASRGYARIIGASIGRSTGKEASSGSGINGIAKTYIDLHRNSSSSQLDLKLDAYAIVFVLFFVDAGVDKLLPTY